MRVTLCENMRAVPYVPFKINSRGDTPSAPAILPSVASVIVTCPPVSKLLQAARPANPAAFASFYRICRLLPCRWFLV